MENTNIETVLWARKIGAADWQEDLITSTANPEHLAAARKWALANGFEKLRESKLNLEERPDFVSCINK